METNPGKLAASDRDLRRLAFAAAAACLILLGTSGEAAADDAEATFRDIEETYGTVPGFFRLFASEDLTDAWYEFRTLQLNPYLTTKARTRELISVAAAAQGPCRPCVYFHAAAALVNGASKEEIREAIGIGAATRRLGAFLAEAGTEDIDTFSRETDLLLWGDAKTLELRGPPVGFCDFVIAWAGADYVGCD